MTYRTLEEHNALYADRLRRKNLYAAATAAGAATLGLYAFSGIFGISGKVIFSSALATAGIGALQAFRGYAAATNDSGAEIFAKSEDGAEVVCVPHGETVYGIDGVKTNGRVFKLRDGVHATVGRNGNITVKSFVGKIVNLPKGGRLSAPPDETWRPLFDA